VPSVLSSIVHNDNKFPYTDLFQVARECRQRLW